MDQMVQITVNRWNEAKGSILDHLSEPISGSAHLPIYRSKTKFVIIWFIDMTWTLRLRYRKLPSIESDIGDGPLTDHFGSFGTDIGDDSGPVAPVAANRFGKRSAPECRGAFCMPCSGTDTEHTGKAIRTDIRTRNKAKRKASQKRTHRKRSHTQPKANQKNKQSNNRQKNIHTHNQSRKPKTIPTKKKPRASCTRLRG